MNFSPLLFPRYAHSTSLPTSTTDSRRTLAGSLVSLAFLRAFCSRRFSFFPFRCLCSESLSPLLNERLIPRFSRVRRESEESKTCEGLKGSERDAIDRSDATAESHCGSLARYGVGRQLCTCTFDASQRVLSPTSRVGPSSARQNLFNLAPLSPLSPSCHSLPTHSPPHSTLYVPPSPLPSYISLH